MAAKSKTAGPLQRRNIQPEIPQRLRDVAAELRQLLDGEQGCPEWGTL